MAWQIVYDAAIKALIGVAAFATAVEKGSLFAQVLKETSGHTPDDTKIVFPWSDVEDSPARSRPRTRTAATEPATPKFGTPATENADATLPISWPDVEDSPIQANRPTGIVPAEDKQHSAAPAPGPPRQLKTRGRGRGPP
ncbi:hypothetical protein ACHAPO_006901 [Fusarium lateritium]